MDLYYIGLDLGTTNMKAAAVSPEGTILAIASDAMVYDIDGAKVEFDLTRFYKSVCDLIKKLVESLPQKKPGGVCISSASGNTVLLDDQNLPLIPAISWLDTRHSGDIQAVMGSLDPSDVYKLVGWRLGERFPLAHLCRIKHIAPELLEKAGKIGMSTDYLNFCLCNVWAMDHSTATTFYLQNQATGKWHRPFLEALEIPESKLPRLLPSGTRIGGITDKASADTLLPRGTPVFLGSFDHPSAAIGTGVINEGSLLLSCGTSWVGFTPIRDRERVIKAGLMCDPFLEEEGLWAGYFSLSNAGQKIDAYLDKFLSKTPDRLKEFDTLAAKANSGAAGLELDIYAEPPADLQKYEKHNIARAVMESVGYHFKNRMKILADYDIPVTNITMSGGPSKSPIWPGIVSDIIGMPIRILSDGAHAGALGAAKIACKNDIR